MLEHHEDTHDDVVGALLLRIQRLEAGPQERHRYVVRLARLMRRYGYSTFVADYRRYGLTRIAQSSLVDVPPDQRGHLLEFRGERIRLVCLSSGPRSLRLYMAGRPATVASDGSS